MDEIPLRIVRRCDSADLDACFPFQALAVSAPASVFYAFLHDGDDVFLLNAFDVIILRTEVLMS